ncbi:phosphate/phosphite/phosphonate ABC transporter substrate-binding protein [Hahella aquimaris]|uniref:phosphate/phosphite/phosphonate ABC transporter substrate-binding protein n=1 Tax=Hahella sp. HNIBRBA332 TaxID=3015983 RepID=UPI00273B2A67|nr:phosphate/phosphite/phosphonate ABC transporter substrate-binding protein [Hahella sp. HNIBRBA332]WLQ16666.1 phosphate/phosphite/phosphonate ABC transporter substrate-binding protein [Hahella sp. HNIBRBA332]
MRILITFLCLIYAALVSANLSATEAQAYEFGIVPQQSAEKLARAWGPVLSYIEQDSGVRLLFKTAPDIPEFESRLGRGQYHFAYMNPYHFVVYNKYPGYQAMAREKDKMIKGIIVVAADSSIQDLQSLQGADLAFPAPAAFAASVLPQAILARQGIRIQPQYVLTHDSVYLNVMQKRFIAGGGVMRTFNAMPDEVTRNLRILWTTPAYTPHAIASAPGVPPQVVKAVTQAMTRMGDSEQGRALLQPLSMRGFIPAANADWDDIRALQIDLL